jgi:iron(III) transport system permease protein
MPLMPVYAKAGAPISAGRVSAFIGLLAFFLLVFGPLLFLIPSVVREISANGTQTLLLMLPVGRRLSLLVSSLLYAAGVSACGTVVGLLCASFFATRNQRWARIVPILFLAVLPIPPTIHALAWMAAWAHVRGWLTAHGFFFPPLWGWFGAMWVQTMSLIPFSFGICLIALRNLDPLLIDAARTMGDDQRTIFKVALPLIFPALITTAVFLFVMTLSDYTVASLFSVNVYPLEIFSDFSTENSPARALLLSVPLLVIAAAVVLSAQSTMRDVAAETPKGPLGASLHLGFGPWTGRLAVACLALALFCFVVPTFALCFDVGSASNLAAAVAPAKGAIYTTVICALAAALIALVPSLLWAGTIRTISHMGKVLWVMALVMPAIPGSLFAVGLIYMGNMPVFAPLNDTLIFPILVSVGRFSPWAAILLFCFGRRIDPILFDAAAVHEPGPAAGFIKVSLPLMLPGIIAAAILVGVLAAGELSGTLLVLPPGVDTVIPRIFTYLHYGATPQTAALSLVMSWGFLALFAVSLWLLGRHTATSERNNDSSQ